MHTALWYLGGLIYALLVILALLAAIIAPAILLLVILRYFNEREIEKLLSKKKLR
jgi:hypothetical protein